MIKAFVIVNYLVFFLQPCRCCLPFLLHLYYTTIML
nr:MAG TPA: Protein of unknown function (DUF1203) [Caudoviricetes sp.]